MAQEVVIPVDEVLLGEEIDHVRLITLNRPRQLNVISSKVVSLLAEYLEKWEKDNKAELVIIKGAFVKAVGDDPFWSSTLFQNGAFSSNAKKHGTGRAFSAGGDLKMFYDGRKSKDSCLEVVYRMYWLCYHIHTYKKTQVALVHGISMGGGASLMVPMKFSVVTEKTVFSTPEASIGFHTDCGFSYIHSHLPGHLGEFLALTGARLNGKELVAAGLATHFVPFEKLPELEKRLISLNSGDKNAVKSAIEEFSVEVQLDADSVLNKKSIIDECFSKDTVAEIIKSLEAEASKEGNGWIGAILKGLKRSSPTGLKITLRSSLSSILAKLIAAAFLLFLGCFPKLVAVSQYFGELFIPPLGCRVFGRLSRPLFKAYSTFFLLQQLFVGVWVAGSIREGRKQTLPESLKKEFRLTMNILRTSISEDVYEGIRALTIDKDNAPKWEPPSLDKVDEEKVDLVFQPFKEDLELQIPEREESRWHGKYETTPYATSKVIA
uniref:3-hydroxyisobutyryl-CoA hydrolase n=1 Tax=Fagus sylvatica TaxID=28930 RepID=A0A2N9IAD1_FAGSY